MPAAAALSMRTAGLLLSFWRAIIAGCVDWGLDVVKSSSLFAGASSFEFVYGMVEREIKKVGMEGTAIIVLSVFEDI